MNIILDKLLIFLYCLTLYLFQIEISYAIIPVILVTTLSCLFVYFEDDRIKLAGTFLYALLCLFVPEYIIFLPIILYDILNTKYQLATFIVPLIFLSNADSLSIVAFTSISIISAYFLKRKTDKLNLLQTEYNDLRDASSSISQLLEEKNRSILKNQDYEVNLATLNERNRISKEIHDHIGHLLSRSLLQVGALLTISNEEPVEEGLTALKESLSGGMDEIRTSIHKMYDESIDLYMQIEQLVKAFSFCPINFEYDIKTQPALVLKLTLIAIIKEATANIIRHSNATNVSILLREHPAMYQLIIEDNGTISEQKRFMLKEYTEKQNYADGMGLRNIYDRVKGSNGNLNISLESGFKLFITIPKQGA